MLSSSSLSLLYLTNAPVIWNPCIPHLGLSGAFTFYASESEWSPRAPGDKLSGAFPRSYFSTHGTPFVKQLIIAKGNLLLAAVK